MPRGDRAELGCQIDEKRPLVRTVLQKVDGGVGDQARLIDLLAGLVRIAVAIDDPLECLVAGPK